MESIQYYDAIVVGAGQAGGPLATALAKVGRETALVEREHVGGTCINEGCTPTKTMIASGRVAYLARRVADYGVHIGPVSVDIGKVRQRKRDIVESFRSGSETKLKSTDGPGPDPRRSALLWPQDSGGAPEGGRDPHDPRRPDLSRDLLVAKLPVSHVACALEVDETRGFIKAIVEAKTKQILGAAMGIEGGEVMSTLQVAMMGKLPYIALRDGVFAHPTLCESLNNMFMGLKGPKDTRD